MKRLLLLFTICLSFASSGQNCSDLFFSEYVEGWSNNKALEIYNPTQDTIDLSEYMIIRYSNGSTSATVTNAVQLIGTILPFDVYVAVIEKIDPNGTGQETPIWPELQALADGFYCPDFNISNAFYFNGNDAVVLAKGTIANINGSQAIDIFGKIGEDPDIGVVGPTDYNGWSTDFPYVGAGVVVTTDHSLIRKSNILKGVTNPIISFFDPLLEYDSISAVVFDTILGYNVGNWDSLGFHNCDCSNSVPNFTVSSNSICQNDQIVVTDMSANVTLWNWNFGNSATPSVAIGPGPHTVSYNSPGLKTIVLTVDNGITYTDSLLVSSVSLNNLSVTTCDSYNLNGQIYNISGNYTQVLTNSVGCDSTIYLDLIINNSSSNLITENTCGSYTLNGQTYTSSGTYTQTLTNAQGCDSTITLNLTVNPNSFNPSFTVNQTLFTSPPFVCQFTNTTPSMGNYNFTWYWGDGTSLVSNNPSVFHEYLYNGLYTVTLIAEDMNTGCSDTVIYSDYIYTAGGVSCTHSSIINQTGSLNVCSGDTLLLSCNSSGTFTYQWNRNGVTIPNSDNDTLYITEGGTYTVTIIEGGCPVTSSPINVTEDNITQPVISSSGTIISCSGGSVTLDAGGGYSSYSWSSGGNQQQEGVSQSGSYTVTVTSSNGCSSTSAPFVVNASFLPMQEICIVGVDSLTNYNRIIWEKPLIAGIDSFYVYRETNVSDVYGFIGSIDYEDTAIFIDYGSNPGVQPFRYKLSMLDTCGVETSLGDFHKTIHLTINQGAGNTYNLIWSSYEGLSFGSYNIYRGTSPTNMSLLATVQSNINSYSDLNPPVGTVYYQIEIVGPNCNPLKANNYNSSRSNVADNGLSGLSFIEKVENIVVYPNPTSNSFTISSEKVINSEFKIIDSQGREVLTGSMNGQEHTIDISKLSMGVYSVVFDNTDYPMVRVIKE